MGDPSRDPEAEKNGKPWLNDSNNEHLELAGVTSSGITNYTELKTAIGNNLGRSDLTR